MPKTDVDINTGGTTGAKAPTGSMLLWTTDTAPSGWLLCYGQAISRTTYVTLFGVIGTTYGIGDGSTTFNLPDMRGRVPLGQDDMGGTSADRVTDSDADALGGADGAETHTLVEGETPAHTHDGALGSTLLHTPYTHFAGAKNSIGVSIATSSFGGDGAHNNLQPFLTLNYMIKT